MRNLMVYPVTKSEVTEYLNRLADEQDKSLRIGGIDGVIIKILHQLVDNSSEEDISTAMK